MTQTANVETWLQRRRGRGGGSGGIARVERGGPLAMSFGQEQMWFLDQLTPDSVEYLVPFAVRLRGELDRTALARAWDELVARHEILRTRHVLEDGKPCQVIDEPACDGAAGMAVVSVSGAPQRNRAARVDDVLATQAATPFDLAREWPARATLVEVSDVEHVLLVMFHHIACDAWSSRLALSELWALYAAAKDGTTADLPPLSVQYADFAAWQRSRLSDDVRDRQLAHWQDVLSGVPQLDLPADLPRPPVRGYAGAEVDFEMPPEVGAEVAALAGACNTTPFVVLLTAFGALLARYSGNTDVPVGTIVSGRTRPELQQLVGNAINTLVIRTRANPDATFRELLGEVRNTVLDAFDHSAVPFAQVVDKVAPRRDPSRTPLYQAVFSWHESAGAAAEEVAGLTLEPVEAGGGVARCDLELQVGRAADGGLRARLIYATELFEAPTIERMAAHLSRLLARAVGDPDRRLAAIGMFDEVELASLTAPAEPMPDGPDVLRRFDRQVARTPDDVAVRTDDGETTYAELSAMADRIARRLRAAGAGPEDVVGILLDRGVDLLAAMLATWRTGAAYLPIGPELPPLRWGDLLADSGARILVTGPDTDRLAEIADVFDGHVLVPGADDAPEAELPGVSDLDGLAYVVYTSGSTGRPKGVAVTHRGLVNHLDWVIDTYIGDGTGGAPLFATVAGDVVVPTLFAPLLVGQPVHMFPQDLDMARLGERLAAGKPYAFVKLTPGHLEMLSHQLAPADIDGLAGNVVTGGDVLLDTVARQWNEWLGDGRLVNEYGPTEITVGNSTFLPGTTSRREVVPIGAPIPHTSMYVLDESLRPAAVGVVGEVCVGGAGVTRGYLGRPGQTAEKFVPDPFGPPGSRLYRTGDLGRVMRDGNVEFTGRADTQVKVRGYRVELGEIEGVVSGYPEVGECRVVLRGDDDQRRLVAYVVGAEVDTGRLEDRLAGSLPEYMVPKVVVLDRIPLTANGKLDIAALPELSGPDADYVAPRNALEEKVAQLWADALRVDRVGVHDGFFDLGGDSIRAVSLVGAMRHAGYDLSVADVFGHASVARIAELIQGREQVDEDRGVAPFALISDEDRAKLPARGVVDAYPLSQNQTGMIFEMLADEQHPYHCTTTFWIRDGAEFSLDAMIGASRLLSKRHEALRTSLHLDGFSVPMQLVHDDAFMSTGMRDLRGKTTDEVEEIVQEHVARERADLFDMKVPGLMRFFAFPTDHDGYWLSITECHPVQEGWGYHSMVMELLTCYGSLRKGEEPVPYETPEVRFADFVAEELEALGSEEHRGYWRGIVADHTPFALPDEWADRDAECAKHQAITDWRDLKPRLREAAAATGVSMKSIMIAAFTKVLAQFTDDAAFHFGLITDARPERRGADTVYGMYLNTLPFAVHRPAGTWRDLLLATFDREVEMWPHRQFPYPEITRMADKRRRFIDVMFNYHDFNQVDTDLVAERTGLDDSPTDFGLTVSTRVDLVLVTADHRKLAPEQAELVAKLFRRALEGIAGDLDADASVAMLPDEDRQWLLDAARSPAAPSGEVSHVLEAFGRQVARIPDTVAVRCGDETLTFAELDEHSDRLAHRLRANGFEPGSLACVIARRDLNLLTSLLATWKAGGAYLPLAPNVPAERLAYVLDDSGARCVLAAPDLADLVPASFAGPTVLADATGADPNGTPLPPVRPDGLAYVIYTSGSTGRPKGVQVGHATLANYLSWVAADYTAGGDGGAPVLSGVAADLLVTALFGPLVVGQPVHVLPDGLDLSELGEKLLAGAPYSFVKLTPGHLEVLAQQLHEPIAKTMVVGGEALLRPVAQRWAAMLGEGRVVNEYGLTETTVGNAVYTFADDDRPVVPVGKPIPGTSMYVLDTHLELVPRGVVGEVCVAGAALSWGYANRAGMTAARFVPNPYGPPGSRLYRTGDLGRVLADGSVDLIGRRDGMVKVRGYRVELGEIESMLGEHPLVTEARVLLHATAHGDRQLVAYLVPARADDPVGLDLLRPWLADRLPDYMHPSTLVHLERIPLTPNGKLDTAALPEPDGRDTGDTYVAPEGPMEELVADIWSEVLGKRVGTQDAFIDIGGDSIRAVALTGALRNAALKVTVRDLFAHPTVSLLARMLAERAPANH
jgi:amino acid adenylation domain-containing protein